MIKKTRITINKIVRCHTRMKKNGEPSNQARQAIRPQIGIKYDTEKNEMVVAGPHAVATYVDEIALEWFKGTKVREVVANCNSKGQAVGKYKLLLFCPASVWKRGKRVCINKALKQTAIGPDGERCKLFTIEFGVNLGRTIH